MSEAPPHPSEFRPAAPGSPATLFVCGLCGLGFSHGDQACGGCLLGNGCRLVRCPRCGFQFPREAASLGWARRAWRRLTRRSP